MYSSPFMKNNNIKKPDWLTPIPSQDEIKKVLDSAKLKFIDGPDNDEYFVYITINSKLITKNHMRDGGQISGFFYYAHINNGNVVVDLSNIEVDRPD